MIPRFEYHNHWFEYRQATDKDLDKFERKTNLTLPSNLRAFIRKLGTMSPGPDSFAIQGRAVDDSADCQKFYGFPGNKRKKIDDGGVPERRAMEKENYKYRTKEGARLHEEPNSYDDLLTVWKIFQGRIPLTCCPLALLLMAIRFV